MSIESHLKKVEGLYSSNVTNLGVGPKAVGWNTAEAQDLRFAKLSTIVQGDDNYTVNDYGCGYGAHLLYLTETMGHKVSAYNGYDISTDMLDAAKNNLSSYEGDLNLIESSDITKPADYTFISGTFNVRFEADNDIWENLIREKLAQAFAMSNKAMSFNLMTSYVDWEESHLYYGDPCVWFDYCKKNLSKNVSLLHDYPLWEWTITVTK